MNIQTIINKLSNEHEPRLKKVNTMRLLRERQFDASNRELKVWVYSNDQAALAAERNSKNIFKNS